MTQRTQGPIKEFKAGTVKAAIWRNELENQGRTVIKHSVKTQKRYSDETSQTWQDTVYFFANALPRLRVVAEKAFEYIALRENDDHSENRERG